MKDKLLKIWDQKKVVVVKAVGVLAGAALGVAVTAFLFQNDPLIPEIEPADTEETPF